MCRLDDTLIYLGKVEYAGRQNVLFWWYNGDVECYVESFYRKGGMGVKIVRNFFPKRRVVEVMIKAIRNISYRQEGSYVAIGLEGDSTKKRKKRRAQST